MSDFYCSRNLCSRLRESGDCRRIASNQARRRLETAAKLSERGRAHDQDRRTPTSTSRRSTALDSSDKILTDQQAGSTRVGLRLTRAGPGVPNLCTQAHGHRRTGVDTDGADVQVGPRERTSMDVYGQAARDS